MTVMRWDGRKWPEVPHWQYEMLPLGEDSYGLWFHVPAGTMTQRGQDPPGKEEVGFVHLITRNAWWTAEFYRGHRWLSRYVNIGTPCAWEETSVSQVDLDLDVVRRNDGSVDIIDEDEFELHQVRYGYPQHLIDQARRTADSMYDVLVAHDEPFDAVGEHWLDVARETTR